jgi:3-isopropylmalate/(R)-2-methylmalate dehydratase large subunit
MVIEAGAKNGIFPADDKVKEYLKDRTRNKGIVFQADPDAEYERTVEINVTGIKPLVAYPHLPENIHEAAEGNNIKIDQVVIGSCTNGRIEDLRIAALILKGRKVAKGVRCLIIPATPAIYRQALDEGLFTIFLDAGAVISPPTCGPCLGGHMGILASGERCVSTTNRNFIGRMGHKQSEVYLASPATAAASAISGTITSPEQIIKG